MVTIVVCEIVPVTLTSAPVWLVLLIETMPVGLADQVAVDETSTVELCPCTVASALNSCVEVELIVAVVGLTFTLVTFPRVTFTVPVPLTVPDCAVMVALPDEAAVTTPA